MKKFLNPFRYLAGAKALAIGSIFILATSVLLHAASMVQDNLLHFAFVPHLSFLQVLLVQVVLWVLTALLLYGAGAILSRSKIRPIDIFGTTAFAQLPLLLLNLPFLSSRFAAFIGKDLLNDVQAGLLPTGGELALLLLFVLYGLALLVLYWVWNYRAYSVSCNVHGSKAVVLYIAALVVGTIVSPWLVGFVI